MITIIAHDIGKVEAIYETTITVIHVENVFCGWDVCCLHIYYIRKKLSKWYIINNNSNYILQYHWRYISQGTQFIGGLYLSGHSGGTSCVTVEAKLKCAACGSAQLVGICERIASLEIGSCPVVIAQNSINI